MPITISIPDDAAGGLTVAALASITGKSVAQIVAIAGATPTPSTPESAKRKAKNGKPAKRKANAVDTSTPAAREAYDRAVLDAIEDKGTMSAGAVRAAIGGTPLQARVALGRLVQAGAITYSGRARSTVYHAVAEEQAAQ